MVTPHEGSSIPTASASSAVVPAAAEQKTPETPVRATNTADTFQTVEHRLRSLGAVYYLLETWGPRGDLYRFHCKMEVPDSGGLTRHFEATDADPTSAMLSVQQQVELWHAGLVPSR